MKSPQRNLVKRTQPSWWSVVLSVLVALSLVLQPACLCAIAEASGHAAHGGGHSHGAKADDHHGGHDTAHHHQESKNRTDTQEISNAIPVLTATGHDACCCDSQSQPLVAASVSRSAAPDQTSLHLALSPVDLPFAPVVFTLTNCHGRDGPPGRSLRTQFVPSSLLGRAPPSYI